MLVPKEIVKGKDVKRFEITNRATLAEARNAIDFDEVVVNTAEIKRRNLLPCALKYALWALRPGGRLIVNDEGLMDAGPPPYVFPFNLVRQCTFKFLANDTSLIDFDQRGRIVMERHAPVLGPAWSAGVIFSGNKAELPVLHSCLDSLRNQPELSPEMFGEIAVCGPHAARELLSEHKDVRWIDYDEPPGDRFLICKKKNLLIDSLKNPKIVILHARIKLANDALTRTPREFDISGPNTSFLHNNRLIPYPSLTQSDSVWPGILPRRRTLSSRQLSDADPILLHERAGLFVDGSAFYVRRAAWKSCPLNDAIAWLEGEDVEWCSRAFLQGFLIDMAPQSLATSQTNKLSIPPNLGSWTPKAARAISIMRSGKSMMKHAIEPFFRKKDQI
ncbi:hypothetical protein [Methylobacterium longum]|uniref:Uncharacterized protein n=1 Tax=Methylobacterium longum TaxID=767694 RepID=A0ABT8AZ30_9HYPH|nr:hypothetical protein [Methylobacterium longum]MDN3574700.1 hypothetical protein [Methylobacterium longum]GJE15156.1 hypothetical protein FOHLNKBM_6234 [Methylobacterium longum]